MNMKNELKHRIPEHWTPDMALCFVGFLDQLATAVWDQHGYAMSDLLEKQVSHELGKSPDLNATVDDEIPF